MAHSYVTNPVLSELDDIAAELEKTGNSDLAILVDEVGAELITAAAQRRSVSAKKKSDKKDEKKDDKKDEKARAKKNKKPAKKEAEVNFSSRRAKIAMAMRKIARAQVAELEDIAAELIKEGEKKAALEVLKIAEELDSDYEYSASGKHSKPESKGDASKRFNRETANKPDAKMDTEEKEDLELPFGEKGEGYPKQSQFEKKLAELLRLAGEEDGEGAPPAFGGEEADSSDSADEDMDLSEESEESEEDSEESDEDDGDLDMGGLGDDTEEGGSDEGGDADDLDLSGLDLGDGEDELAAMMDAMEGAEPSDMEASDRMYETEEPALEGEEGEEGEELGAPAPAESPLGEEGEEDELSLGEDGDTQAMDLMPNLEVSGPMGTGMKFSSAERAKLVTLAKKLAAKGEKGLAARLAKFAK